MSNISFPRDNNRIATLGATSSVDGVTPVAVYADPTSHRLLVDISGLGIVLETNGVTNGSQSLLNLVQGSNVTITDDGVGNVTIAATGGGGGSGTVTSVSIVTANGLSGSVANATTTPAVTLDISGLDATKIANGSVSSTEFQYLDGVSSAIQTQIDTKVTGAGSATDNAITRFDSTTGKLIQNSDITISDVAANLVTLTTLGDVNTTFTNNGDGYGYSFIASDGTTSGSGGGSILNQTGSATLGNADGGDFTNNAGNGHGSGVGGTFFNTAGDGGATGAGGDFEARAGLGGATSGKGGDAFVAAGSAQGGTSNGGIVYLVPGNKTGAGTVGHVKITDAASTLNAVLDTSLIATSDKTYTLPNTSGTFMLIPASPADYTVTNVTTDRTYNANATTTDELADVLGTLIADLQALGLIQ